MTWLSFAARRGDTLPGMPATTPTIVATSGGYRSGSRTPLELDALVSHAVERSGVSGRTPRLAYLGTANGDQQFRIAQLAEAARLRGYELRPLTLFTMPNVEDVEAYLHEADVVWVDGGSVANLLAVWRVHCLDAIFGRLWRAGVVLAGISAGSICWFRAGTTDDGAGLVFEGTHLAEVVTERDGAAGYLVRRGPDGDVVEERLEARRLP